MRVDYSIVLFNIDQLFMLLVTMVIAGLINTGFQRLILGSNRVKQTKQQ